MKKTFETCSFEVFIGETVKIKGTSFNLSNLFVEFYAPASPTITHSFTGSGLPFPTKEIAFQSENNGITKMNGKKFEFNLKMPNSYYDNGKYIRPHVKMYFCDHSGKRYGKPICLVLSEGVPFRYLDFKNRNYNQKPLPIGTQYQLLCAKSYSEEPTDFWGFRRPEP